MLSLVKVNTSFWTITRLLISLRPPQAHKNTLTAIAASITAMLRVLLSFIHCKGNCFSAYFLLELKKDVLLRQIISGKSYLELQLSP